MSLEEVWERIEAFRNDLEDLDVQVDIDVTEAVFMIDPRVNLYLKVVVPEDLEAEEAEG